MKKALSLAIASALISGAMVSTASAEVTGNLGATSNYLWRGASQSGNAAAISGGIDYAADSGFYAGTWGSTTDGNIGEADFYTGFGQSFDDFSYDLGYIAYTYPGASEANFAEVYLGLAYSFFSLKYSTLAHDTKDTDFADSSYIEGAFDYEVAKDLSLGLHVGSTLTDGDDVVDYNISLTKSFELGDASFLVSKTNADDDDVYYSDSAIFAVTWSTGFDLL